MVENEKCHCVNLTIECRHGLDPLGEIIDSHNDVVVATGRGSITCHEVNLPLTEGTNYDHRMQQHGRSP